MLNDAARHTTAPAQNSFDRMACLLIKIFLGFSVDQPQLYCPRRNGVNVTSSVRPMAVIVVRPSDHAFFRGRVGFPRWPTVSDCRRFNHASITYRITI